MKWDSEKKKQYASLIRADGIYVAGNGLRTTDNSKLTLSCQRREYSKSSRLSIRPQESGILSVHSSAAPGAGPSLCQGRGMSRDFKSIVTFMECILGFTGEPPEAFLPVVGDDVDDIPVCDPRLDSFPEFHGEEIPVL